MMLPTLELARAGYVHEGGVDKYFLDRARGKKDIVELESAVGQHVFFARNRRMLERLQALLAQPGRTCFVVVGAGHGVGKDGLVDLFTRAGHRVRQLP